MKTILLTFGLVCIASSSTAQYKDSLKTFRKLTKSFQKSSEYSFIPSGSYVRGGNDSDIPTYAVNGNYLRNSVMTVDSFFMGKFEISNEKYLEFVKDKIKQDSIQGRNFLPDTLVWRTPLAFGEKYVDYYFRHPAYANYPVVGVSYDQAKAYAEWMSFNYNANEERVFKKVKFRIPTEEEWEYACKGGFSYSYLPWGTNSTFDEKGKLRANFRAVSQFSVYRDSAVVTFNGETKKRPVYLSTGSRMQISSMDAMDFYDYDFTSPVDAYLPNPYGIYNMAGNVAEMVDAYYFRDPNVYTITHGYSSVKSDKPWGVTKGGSWNDTGYYLQYPVRQFYTDQNFSSSKMGFRLVMEVLEY